MRNSYMLISILALLMTAGCTKEQSIEAPGYRLKIRIVPMANGIRLVKDAVQTLSLIHI